MNNVSIVSIVILMLAAVFGMSQLSAQDNSRLEKVQDGTLTLTCHLPKGVVVIEPELVTDYHSETGWKFSNGAAKSCWTN